MPEPRENLLTKVSAKTVSTRREKPADPKHDGETDTEQPGKEVSPIIGASVAPERTCVPGLHHGLSSAMSTALEIPMTFMRGWIISTVFYRHRSQEA